MTTISPKLEEMYAALGTVEKTKGTLNQDQKALFFLAYTLGYVDGNKKDDEETRD